MATEAEELALPTSAGTLLRDNMLRERFIRLWQHCLLPGARDKAAAVWQELSDRYGEAHRHYHDEGHLAHCLGQLDLAACEIGRPGQVEMAIWFHDAINDPGATDNEARSARLFREQAAGAMAADFVAAVEDLILVTTHDHEPDDLDHRFMCDIDLASFGCPWECFMRDSENLRAEFPGPDEAYILGKRAFLESLLARPQIFSTDFFRSRFEEQARANIRGLLSLIGSERGWNAATRDRS